MPELPEVESIRRYLAGEGLRGYAIADVDVEWPGTVAEPYSNVSAFRASIRRKRIADIARRGKYLILALVDPDGACQDTSMVMHMGMSGSLHVRREEDSPLRFARNVIWLEDGRRIEIVDPRKWAKLWAATDPRSAYPHLGPEPWDVGPAEFAKIFSTRKAPIKSTLLNQSLIAGVGNIYADEALHRAGISPIRRANRISRARLESLHRAVVETLEHAVDFISSHPSDDGSPYVVDAYDDRMRIPRFRGGNCPDCSTEISSRRIGGRTSYYCMSCQR